MEPYQIVLLTLAVVVAVMLLVLLIAGKGSLARLGIACRAFFAVMGDAALAERVRPLLGPAQGEEAKKPARLSPEPLRLLTLLQREGRLLDFLLENMEDIANEQVGLRGKCPGNADSLLLPTAQFAGKALGKLGR